MNTVHCAIVATLIVALAGCGGKQAESGIQADTVSVSRPATRGPVTIMLCGADTISVAGPPADTLQLNVQGETFTVSLVPSASGARYQAGTDSTTFYWIHGSQATVQIRGDALPECEVVP